jgi:alpha-L-rhamnosidase
MLIPRLLHFVSLACVCLLFAVRPASIWAAPPPTLDPTYGLPLPSSFQTHTVTHNADWIWAATTEGTQTVYLRRVFTLASVPKSAILSITADDAFTVSVNGTQMGQTTPLTNGWQQVHRINIAPELRLGTNVLAVRGLNTNGAAGVLAQLAIPGHPALKTDGAWKIFTGDNVPADWTTAAFRDAAWLNATVEAPVGSGVWGDSAPLRGWPGYQRITAPYLTHLALPSVNVLDVQPGAGKLMGVETLKGHLNAILTVTLPPAGVKDVPNLVLDFGREVAGRIQVAALTPGTVQVGTGESLEEATQSPWGGIHTLSLTPGATAFTPYSAFRYAHLTFPAGTTHKRLRLRVCLDDKYYPVQYQGSFTCSDPLLTRLWYTGAYTAHLCMQEDIWDAPKRDRARWMGDLNVSGEVINDVFGDKFLMEQTMQRLRDDAQGGRPANQPPADHVNSIPGYSCAWVCTLADFYRHRGDDAYLHKQHALLLSMLEYLRGDTDTNNVFVNTRGQWDFADWSPGYSGGTPESLAATNCFLVKAAHDGTFLLGAMGDHANAAKYGAWAEALTVAARAHLADRKTQTYGSRLQENAMAVCSGVATPAQASRIARTVLDPESSAWDKTGQPPYNTGVITPYYGNYVLYALSRGSDTEAGLRLLRSYWGGMLAEGATTFWEAYDPHWPKQNFHAHLYADDMHGTRVSLCHGWSSGPTAWLTDDVLGVRPTSGGFRTTVIQPELGDLQWAEGTVPTPHGLIHIRVAKKGNSLTCRVTLPSGIDAQVLLPGHMVSLTHAGTYTITSSHVQYKMRAWGKRVVMPSEQF